MMTVYDVIDSHDSSVLFRTNSFQMAHKVCDAHNRTADYRPGHPRYLIAKVDPQPAP